MFIAQIACAAIGVLAFSLFGPGWLARGAALAASIAFMIATGTMHPPGKQISKLVSILHESLPFFLKKKKKLARGSKHENFHSCNMIMINGKRVMCPAFLMEILNIIHVSILDTHFKFCNSA
jgi:HPP family